MVASRHRSALRRRVKAFDLAAARLREVEWAWGRDAMPEIKAFDTARRRLIESIEAAAGRLPDFDVDDAGETDRVPARRVWVEGRLYLATWSSNRVEPDLRVIEAGDLVFAV